VIFCQTKFFIQCIDTWDRLSKSKKIVFLFQSLMRCRSSDLMNRFRQIWWDDVFIHQVWWVAFVIQWDLSSSLMTSHHRRRSTNREQIYVTRQSRINMRHKMTMKWSSMITRTNRHKQSQQKTNLNRISQITSHISRHDAKHVISILSQQFVSVFTTASKTSSERAH
jgi:hypothetical protein